MLLKAKKIKQKKKTTLEILTAGFQVLGVFPRVTTN